MVVCIIIIIIFYIININILIITYYVVDRCYSSTFLRNLAGNSFHLWSAAIALMITFVLLAEGKAATADGFYDNDSDSDHVA